MRTRWSMAVALSGLWVLAGCATPLQQCLALAERDQREIQQELTERRANLQRGYRIEQVLVPVMSREICAGDDGQPRFCTEWGQEFRPTAHPINPELEAERIALLERQLAREAGRAAQAAAQCRVTYPEA